MQLGGTSRLDESVSTSTSWMNWDIFFAVICWRMALPKRSYASTAARRPSSSSTTEFAEKVQAVIRSIPS
ncbi:hypothetical protein VNO78_11568 [Psophocarpus tetragonolobus]|uniref:Uncharacterized protein n=1 Tax=Psophocarpus tetragonolobus TaxID=3891 RepID=A0AAN9SM07_PSOTE